jgi:hypothetical protein
MISNASPTQFGGAVRARNPTTEELIVARRWVEEQKRILCPSRSSSTRIQVVFSSSPPASLTRYLHLGADFDGISAYSPVRDGDVQEYNRNLQRLDQTLTSIEKYIHIAYATLKNEDIVRRLFNMVSPLAPRRDH